MTTQKTKPTYTNILIQDENGLDIIRVSTKALKAFAASHRMQLSAKTIS